MAESQNMRPTPIQIRIYEHKIRIWNIGKMPADVPAEKLFEPHSSEPRNPNIANVFFKAGYVESWGRGYKNITEICEFRNAVLPLPEENCGGLAVECLPNQEYLEAERNKGKIATDVPVNDTINDTIKITATELQIIKQIRQNTYITREGLIEKTKLSDSTIARGLKSLQIKGLIKRTAQRKTDTGKS